MILLNYDTVREGGIDNERNQMAVGETKLSGKIPAELSREINVFEQQMELRKQGRIDEKVFAETRLPFLQQWK